MEGFNNWTTLSTFENVVLVGVIIAFFLYIYSDD